MVTQVTTWRLKDLTGFQNQFSWPNFQAFPLSFDQIYIQNLSGLDWVATWVIVTDFSTTLNDPHSASQRKIT
jgi:hypothetical protein